MDPPSSPGSPPGTPHRSNHLGGGIVVSLPLCLRVHPDFRQSVSCLSVTTLGVSLWSGCRERWDRPTHGSRVGHPRSRLRPVTGESRAQWSLDITRTPSPVHPSVPPQSGTPRSSSPKPRSSSTPSCPTTPAGPSARTTGRSPSEVSDLVLSSTMCPQGTDVEGRPTASNIGVVGMVETVV